MRKMIKWINHYITFLLVLLLITVVTIVITTKVSGDEPEIFGYQLKSVLSGSMEPGIKTGSIIAVKPGGDMNRFKENDVITFQEQDLKLVTHRITEVVHSGDNIMYRTKGDNNNAEDSNLVLSENVIAEYTGFTIPYIGYLINFSQSKNGAFLLLIPGLILLSYSGFTIWRAFSELEASNQGAKEL